MKIKFTSLIIMISVLIPISCTQNPENVAELTAPIVYSLVKNAIKQEKYKGALNIKVEYENLRDEESGWPSGEVKFDVEMMEYEGKHVLVDYILDGTHNATAIVKIPGKDKTQVKVNLYENAIVFGQAKTVENMIIEMSDKLSKKVKPNAKVAVFDFVNIDEKNITFGKRLSESLITHLINNNIIIVERKLLDKVIKEISMNQTGLTAEDARKNIGKFLGADEIVVGTIKIENEEIIINGRVIDLISGVILSSAQGIIPKYLISEKDLKIIY